MHPLKNLSRTSHQYGGLRAGDHHTMDIRIGLKYRNRSYNFLKIHHMKEGSLVFNFPKPLPKNPSHKIFDIKTMSVSEGVGNERDKITYHHTGQVNYHGIVTGVSSCFFEPLCDIKADNIFFIYSVPMVDRLKEIVPDNRPQDVDAFITVSDDCVGRLTFYFSISPRENGCDNKLIQLDWKVFSLVVASAENVPHHPSIDNHFHYIAPAIGMFPEMVERINFTDLISGRDFDKKEKTRFNSEIAYHQKATHGRQDIVIYGPNGEGVFTIYPAVEMRSIPKVVITFKNNGYEVVVLPESRPSKILFRINTKSGIVKAFDFAENVLDIALDSRL